MSQADMTTIATCTVELTHSQARDLTDRIKVATRRLYSDLQEAYEGRAWKALGYNSWREYAQAEFSISQSHAYRLLDHARVTAALVYAGAPNSPNGEIVSESEARIIKPHLEEVTAAIETGIADGGDPADVTTNVVAAVKEKHYLHPEGYFRRNSKSGEIPKARAGDRRARRIDRPNRIVENIALEVTTSGEMLDELDVAKLDSGKLDEWINTLESGASALERFIGRMKKRRAELARMRVAAAELRSQAT
jgi:hypothetical protein